jgi:hypothetical protein
MAGLIDAVREYQLVHPVHHLVFDELCNIVENQCIDPYVPEKEWMRDALALLASSYDQKRLESLIDIGVGPFRIADVYVPAYLNTLHSYLRAGYELDPQFAILARAHSQRVGVAIAGQSGTGAEYLSDILALLLETVDSRRVAPIVEEVWNFATSCITGKARVWLWVLRIGIGTLGLSILLLVMALLRQLVVNNWVWLEPVSTLVQWGLGLGFAILYVLGLSVPGNFMRNTVDKLFQRLALYLSGKCRVHAGMRTRGWSPPDAHEGSRSYPIDKGA